MGREKGLKKDHGNTIEHTLPTPTLPSVSSTASSARALHFQSKQDMLALNTKRIEKEDKREKNA
jgi:hypothetical protein